MNDSHAALSHGLPWWREASLATGATKQHADLNTVLFEKSSVVAAGVLRAAIGMMHQSRLDGPPGQGQAKSAQRQFIFQRPVQRPADHAARVSIQDDSQKHELFAKPDVGNISAPELIDC